MSKIGKDSLLKIHAHLTQSAEVKQKTAVTCLEQIRDASQLMADTFRSGGKVLICGNGGSAADAQHMAGELVCLLNKKFKRPALPAIALTTNSSIITAFANDFSFDDIFSRQVEALGKKGDLLIGLSTSGNSKNVIQAVKAAKSSKMKILILTADNGKLKNMDIDVVISVPSKNTQYTQEAHLSIEHILCDLVEQELYGHK